MSGRSLPAMTVASFDEVVGLGDDRELDVGVQLFVDLSARPGSDRTAWAARARCCSCSRSLCWGTRRCRRQRFDRILRKVVKPSSYCGPAAGNLVWARQWTPETWDRRRRRSIWPRPARRAAGATVGAAGTAGPHAASNGIVAPSAATRMNWRRFSVCALLNIMFMRRESPLVLTLRRPAVSPSHGSALFVRPSTHKVHHPAVDDARRQRLRADCERCFGLCCVGPGFAASADFANHQARRAGRVRIYSRDFRCGIHTSLRPVGGFAGCAVYECFGAGQQVAQETFHGRGLA